MYYYLVYNSSYTAATCAVQVQSPSGGTNTSGGMETSGELSSFYHQHVLPDYLPAQVQHGSGAHCPTPDS